MANANPKVMEMVEKEIRANPDISNTELREKAVAVDKSTSKLSARQFNAIYPLQVKRALKPRKPRKSRGARKKSAKAAKSAKSTKARKSTKASGTGRSGGTTGAGAGGDGARSAVRDVLMQLARDVASAEGKGDVVDVVAGMERYVDRVMKATG